MEYVDVRQATLDNALCLNNSRKRVLVVIVVVAHCWMNLFCWVLVEGTNCYHLIQIIQQMFSRHA